MVGVADFAVAPVSSVIVNTNNNDTLNNRWLGTRIFPPCLNLLTPELLNTGITLFAEFEAGLVCLDTIATSVGPRYHCARHDTAKSVIRPSPYAAATSAMRAVGPTLVRACEAPTTACPLLA